MTKGVVTSGRLGGVYEEIENWALGQALRITGAPREVYWTDFDSAGDADEVFDVAWPVA